MIGSRHGLRIFVLAICAFAVSYDAAIAQSDTEGMLATISAAARGADNVDRVWPGYKPLKRGFILFEAGEGAYLVSDVAPPAPWASAPSPVPGVAGRLYHRAGGLPGLSGGIHTNYPVGDRVYTAVEYHDNVKETLVTLYHEAFHTYQDSAFNDLSGEFLPAAAIAPRQIAGIELERIILANALGADAGAATDSLIAAFLALRAERMAALPDTVRIVERMLERKEGSAHFIGYVATAAALDLDEARVDRIIRSSLEEDLARHGADLPSRYYRWRSYGTGAAMALVLDRLGADWRGAVASGAAFDVLLERAARIPASAHLLAAAREAFDYETLLKKAEHTVAQAASKLSADPVTDFFALDPYRLVIEVSGDSTFQPSMSFSPGEAGIATPEPSLILLREVERASMTSAAFDITIEDRHVMVDGRAAPFYRLVVLLPSEPSMDGAAITEESVAAPGVTHRITGPGTDLVLRSPGLESVERVGNVITIRMSVR